MSTNVNLPKTGMGIEEATVLRWLKSVGDHVQQGEVIVEVETAKATVEVVAPVTGKLMEILYREGEIAAVNTSIAVIGDP